MESVTVNGRFNKLRGDVKATTEQLELPIGKYDNELIVKTLIIYNKLKNNNIKIF
jgi:hypothetical protein